MLKDLIDVKLVKLNIEAKDWEDAIRQSAQPLVENDKIKTSYVDDIITGVHEVGPYIVITEHVALPHARPEAGALKNAVGIATLANPIEFGNKHNDPVKYLFCFSAVNDQEHLSALAELAGLLENKEFFEILDNAKNAQEIIDYINS